MGFFSRKTIINVSTQHVSLLEEADDSNRKAVLSAVLSRVSISETILRSHMEGMYSMAERYYVYGKNSYTNGLPEGSSDHSAVSILKILPVLITEFPLFSSIKVTRVSQDVADARVFAQSILASKYGYDPATDIVSSPPAGMAGTVLLVDVNSIDVNQVELVFLAENAQESVRVTETVVNFIPDKSYLHITFSHSTSTEDVLWTYELGTNTHPSIELNASTEEVSPYYPVVPIRMDNVDMVAEDKKETSLYKTSKFMMKKLTLNVDDLGASINANENVDNIDFVTFGVKVNIRDNTRIVTEYLARYFYSLYEANINSKSKFDRWLSSPQSVVPPHTDIIIQDGSYRTALNYQYITSVDTAGVLEEATVSFDIQDRAAMVDVLGIRLFESERSGVTYQYQAGPNIIRTVFVYGLMSIDYIYGKHTIDINLEDSANDTTLMMIPVHRRIVKTMKLADRNKLFHSSMYLTISTFDKRKEKWYETSAFSFILVVAAIIITVLTVGTAAPSIVAALGVSYAVAITIAISLQFIISIALKYAAILLVDSLGAEWAKWVIIAVAVVSLYTGKLNLNATLEMFSGLVQGYSQAVQDIIKDMMEEIDKLMERSNKLAEEIDRVMEELLGGRIDIDVAAILLESRRIEPIHLKSESAEQYYPRIQSGLQINKILLGMPSYFHINNLTPPNLDEVLDIFKKR